MVSNHCVWLWVGLRHLGEHLCGVGFWWQVVSNHCATPWVGLRRPAEHLGGDWKAWVKSGSELAKRARTMGADGRHTA